MAKPKVFGDSSQTDHKILNNVTQETQRTFDYNRSVQVIKDGATGWLAAYPSPKKDHATLMNHLLDLMPAGQRPLHVYSDDSKEI